MLEQSSCFKFLLPEGDQELHRCLVRHSSEREGTWDLWERGRDRERGYSDNFWGS